MFAKMPTINQFQLNGLKMAGHPLLNQVRTKTETVIINSKAFHVVLSYNRVVGIAGYVIGVKFSDDNGSMDASIAKPVDGTMLALAVARKTVEMLKPDLESVDILGFYLLTDELEALRAGGARGKIRLYGNQALLMHEELKHRLQHLAQFEVQGGRAWTLSVNPYSSYTQFKEIEIEMAKQMRVTLC